MGEAVITRKGGNQPKLLSTGNCSVVWPGGSYTTVTLPEGVLWKDVISFAVAFFYNWDYGKSNAGYIIKKGNTLYAGWAETSSSVALDLNGNTATIAIAVKSITAITGAYL